MRTYIRKDSRLEEQEAGVHELALPSGMSDKKAARLEALQIVWDHREPLRDGVAASHERDEDLRGMVALA